MKHILYLQKMAVRKIQCQRILIDLHLVTDARTDKKTHTLNPDTTLALRGAKKNNQCEDLAHIISIGVVFL